jgi:hypothetical protein
MKGLDAILQEKDLKAQFAPELGESGVCDWAQLFFLCERLFVNARTVLRKKIINVFTTDIVDIESGSQVIEEGHLMTQGLMLFRKHPKRESPISGRRTRKSKFT